MPDTSKISIRPLTSGRWADIETSFGARGCAVARCCWCLEAYPVDRSGRLDEASLWFGAKSMYDRAGFGEVARRKPHRPVVRLRLA